MSAQRPRSRAALPLAALAAVALAAAALPMQDRDPWPVTFAPAGSGATAVPPAAEMSGPPLLEEYTISVAAPAIAHAASAIALDDGRLRAFWFEGSAEGAADVAIMTAVFDGRGWSEKRVALDPPSVSASLGRYVTKLGNMVPLRRPDGSIWLIHVAVWAFGWAEASLVVQRSTDEGESWTPLRKAVTTPILNRSTLLKSPPVAIAEDELVALPAYQELWVRIPEIFVFDEDGRVIAKSRLLSGRRAIQPVVVPLSETRAIAFVRSQDREENLALRFVSEDAGQSWSRPEPTNVHNEGEPVPVLRLEDGRLLMVTMDGYQRRDEPHPLRLLISEDDGFTWRPLHAFLDAEGEAEQSYPWFMTGPDGTFHILFSRDDQAEIGHIRFNRRWLDERIAALDATGETAAPEVVP